MVGLHPVPRRALVGGKHQPPGCWMLNRTLHPVGPSETDKQVDGHDRLCPQGNLIQQTLLAGTQATAKFRLTESLLPFTRPLPTPMGGGERRACDLTLQTPFNPQTPRFIWHLHKWPWRPLKAGARRVGLWCFGLSPPLLSFCSFSSSAHPPLPQGPLLGTGVGSRGAKVHPLFLRSFQAGSERENPLAGGGAGSCGGWKLWGLGLLPCGERGPREGSV